MSLTAYRAKQILSLAGEGPATSLVELEAPLAFMNDGVLLCRDGRIEALEPYVRYRKRGLPEAVLTDLGDVCLAPGLINAHCHLELSWLGGGKTCSGKGFGRWMESLVSLLRTAPDEAGVQAAIHGVMDALQQNGCVHVADTGSRHPHLVSLAARAGGRYSVLHFLELFGFGAPTTEPVDASIPASGGYFSPVARLLDDEVRARAALSGHALYSTSPEALQAAHAWCVATKRPFSMHLAESEEEDECLMAADGLLYDLLCERVLTPEWKAPGVRPVPLADKYGLLTKNTLAVHCVRCTGEDAEIFARRGVSVCLCPQSNAYIGVGEAPARLFTQKSVLLCLGTDSAASNNAVCMKKEMEEAMRCYGFSRAAVLRMATLNAAQALGGHSLGQLTPGKEAAWSVWDCNAFS